MKKIACLSPNDRTRLIKMASSLPAGSPERKAILAGLKEAVFYTKAKHRLDGVRGHELMPMSVARKIPAIYSQDDVDDPTAWVKLFSPYSGAVWYITEYNPSSKEAFGWAELHPGGGELGYIDIGDLEGLNRNGLPLVERDLYWRPRSLSQAKRDR